MSRFKALLTIISVVVFSTFSTQCNKDQTCRAQITVVDIAGVAVSGATVKLFVSSIPNSDVEVTKTTNANGLAEFAYKDPVILNIKATAPPKRSDTTELIKLERGKTVQKTVTIN